jgi:GDP/UDP-N,N'-diacetylbacillosamine 2-epimerase (hydrolysing)
MKICIITSSRADFGLLKNLIIEIKKNKKFSTSIIASGSHFSRKFGNTQSEIKELGLKISEKIINNFDSSSLFGVSKIMANSIVESSKIYKKLKPDLLIVLGDRYEILASVISAHLSRIPIAHIHGGEVTHGALDDAFRHSITKMSHIHFVANKIYRQRVIQLGEYPKFVFNVGGLGVDSIYKTKFLEKKNLEKKFNIKFQENNFLVNFHPETLNKKKAKQQIKTLLLALKNFKKTNFIFTSPGADLENKEILDEIKKFIKSNRNAYFFKSLGQVNYFSFLSCVDGMIGNSSSGILEMPYFKKGTVNIGNRQSGRICDKSVINIAINKLEIQKAIKKILSKSFLKKIKKSKNNLYGKPGATNKIIKILEKIKYQNIFQKTFFDITFKGKA